MNKKRLLKILSILSPLIIGGAIFMPQIAHAASSCSWWMIFTQAGMAECAAIQGGNLFIGLISTLGQAILEMMSWLVGVAGIVLNMSIVFTLNIKTIYEATPAIEQVWVVIRNISSIFIIFALLYAAITSILGVKGPGFGSLVVRIFMAGILINFSLFFTRVAIDASNLVSMQFYRAIVPVSQKIDISNGNPHEAIKNVLKASFTEGGLSNVFQQSLKLPKIYNDKGGLLRDANSVFLIAVSTIGGSILMFCAAASFLFAGLAFIARLVLLLLIMGFSPLFFVGMIFPKVDSNLTSKWKEYFVPLLTFVPVYLLFMYVAMMFLSNGGFFQALDEAQKNAALGATGNGAYLLSDVGLIFQFLIAFFLINIPLLAALKVGGESTKWANAVTDRVKGVVGRNTLGRVGRAAGKRFDNLAASEFAQSSALGRGATSVLRNLGISQAVRGNLEKVEKGKYGGRQSLGDVEKEDKDRAKVISGVQRRNIQTATLAKILASADHKLSKDHAGIIAGIDVKELQDMEMDELKDPKFITAIPSSKFESLLKELTPTQQGELKKAREEGFATILSKTDPDYVLKTLLKGKPGEIAKLPTKMLVEKNIATNLDAATLKKMVDENVGQDDRDKVRGHIEAEWIAKGGHAAVTAGTMPKQLDKAYNYINGATTF